MMASAAFARTERLGVDIAHVEAVADGLLEMA